VGADESDKKFADESVEVLQTAATK
jgi:hypothetical protein